MGVFKEEAIAFETVEKLQRQIWDDACDYGYSYDTKNPDGNIKGLIDAVNSLKGTSLMKNYENDGKTHTDIEIEIAWEIDEGMECGTRYSIRANVLTKRLPSLRIPRNHNAFITVDFNSYRKPYKK